MISINFPKDLTPGQRARLKLYSHIAIIALVNGVLAALAFFTSGNVVSWQEVGICAVSQALLAGLDALKKYYSASGELPLSVMLDFARQEVAAKAPPAPTSPDLQALANTITNNLLSAQTQISPPGASSNLPSIRQVQSPPVEQMTTIPNIAAIPKQ